MGVKRRGGSRLYGSKERESRAEFRWRVRVIERQGESEGDRDGGKWVRVEREREGRRGGEGRLYNPRHNRRSPP
jgi:hypothetical protein